MLEDERLIWKLKRGDKQALRCIYEKYKDNLLTIAVSLLHDSYAAEDVLHDVFVSFATRIGHLQLHGSLQKYLVTSVVNRVRDKFRKKRPLGVGDDYLGAISSGSDSPEKEVILNEQSLLLADALAKLPLEQRETIILHLKAGMKFREIAKMHGTSISTVQGRYRYGLNKLRNILNGDLRR